MTAIAQWEQLARRFDYSIHVVDDDERLALVQVTDICACFCVDCRTRGRYDDSSDFLPWLSSPHGQVFTFDVPTDEEP